MIKEILFNKSTFIIIDIAIGSLMAFIGILTYGKTRIITHLFFVISALFLYISMIFRVLEKLEILILSEYTVFGMPIIQQIVNNVPMLFMIVGFVILLRQK